jgi:hypothetical protein
MATYDALSARAKRILEGVERCRAQLAEVPDSHLTHAIEALAEAVEDLVMSGPSQPLWIKEND